MMHLANPHRFVAISRRWLVPLSVIACLVYGTGLVWGAFFTPPESLQGGMVKIMYAHVPFAFLSSLIYLAMAIASFLFFIWRFPLAALFCRAAVTPGLFCTAITLVTGALWGKPTWGAYLQWDARTISVVVQLFIYAGYLLLYKAISDRGKAGRICALYCMLSALNLPIIKFSVYWWNSLHQQSSLLRPTGPSMDAVFFYPLLLCLFGACVMMFLLILLRMHILIALRRSEADKIKVRRFVERTSP